MAHKAPGKSFREGISLVQIFRMFPDDATAEAWFVARRWPTGVACPHCGSLNVQTAKLQPSSANRTGAKGSTASATSRAELLPITCSSIG